MDITYLLIVYHFSDILKIMFINNVSKSAQIFYTRCPNNDI